MKTERLSGGQETPMKRLDCYSNTGIDQRNRQEAEQTATKFKEFDRWRRKTTNLEELSKKNQFIMQSESESISGK
jgi:hypothetical protein